MLKDDSINFIFDTRKNKKNNDETPLEFQQRRACDILHLVTKPEKLEVFSEKKKYLKKKKELSDKYNPEKWLSLNCNNASSVSFATHVAKLTHSKIDSPSLFDTIQDRKDCYLTTSSLNKKTIDGAVAGNQFAPIFQFLELELNGTKLAEKIENDDSLLKCFAGNDENKLKKWLAGFSKSLKPSKPATHSLAKQIYFPVTHVNDGSMNNEQDYHLLPNIISSSLAHTIFETVFDDKQKHTRKSFDNRKHSDSVSREYPNRSHLSVTASNHSNASQLNGKRAGKLHLFSCQPPTWQSQLKPPINRRTLFDALYNSAIKTELDYLRDFLLRFKRLDLSFKDPKRKHHLVRWVENIIDECLFYIASIQKLPAGWSCTEGVRLKPEHQYLLDPYRLDDSFQAARQNTHWQTVVHADFAQWMNRKLRGKDKQFTPQAEHTRLWKKMIEGTLREHMEPIEQEIKLAMKEAV